MRSLPATERAIEDALGLGLPLLARAEAEGTPWITASVIHGPAIMLGAAQRAGRVLRLPACAAAGTAVHRRATAGTAVYAGGRAIVWTLALPHTAAIAPDATARTLLNRNVRGFLQGLSRAGAIAHYFGREWVSVRKRPAAVLGFTTTPGGAALIEVLAGVDAPPALPAALASDEERAVDRWLGKAPAALGELIAEDPVTLAREVMRVVARWAAAPLDEGAAIAPAPAAPVTTDDDPLPPGFTPGPALRAPIGWIDTAVDRAAGRVWIGGDVIAPAWALAAIAAGESEVGEVPVEGAAITDLIGAALAARAAIGA